MTDLNIIRGDDKTFNINFTEDSSPMNISGATVFMTVKEKYTDSDANALFATEVTSHLVPASGQTAVSITSGSSSAFDPGTYVFDLQLKNVSGDISTPVRGNFIVYPDVTRRTT